MGLGWVGMGMAVWDGMGWDEMCRNWWGWGWKPVQNSRRYAFLMGDVLHIARKYSNRRISVVYVAFKPKK